MLVHMPIKHDKQREWLEKQHHILECCPLLKQIISTEVIESFDHDQQVLWMLKVLAYSFI